MPPTLQNILPFLILTNFFINPLNILNSDNISIFIVENIGWRNAFVVTGLLTWLLVIPLTMVFRSKPEDYGQLPDGDTPNNNTSNAQRTNTSKVSNADGPQLSLTVSQALRTRSFWALTVVFGASTMGTSALGVHQIPYFESIGFNAAQAVSALGFYTIFLSHIHI